MSTHNVRAIVCDDCGQIGEAYWPTKDDIDQREATAKRLAATGWTISGKPPFLHDVCPRCTRGREPYSPLKPPAEEVEA